MPACIIGKSKKHISAKKGNDLALMWLTNCGLVHKVYRDMFQPMKVGMRFDC